MLETADVNEKPIFSDQATEEHENDWFGWRSAVYGAIESFASQQAEPVFAQLGGPGLQIGSWLAEIQSKSPSFQVILKIFGELTC